MPTGIAIATSLLEPLGKLIAEELADGQKSEKEATRAALLRLAQDEHIEPVMPKIQAIIAEARKPKADRG